MSQIVCHYCGMSTWHEEKHHCDNPMCETDASVFRRTDGTPVLKVWGVERIITEQEYKVCVNDPNNYFSIGDWQNESKI